MRGYIAAAVVVSLLAIAGYFGLFGGSAVRALLARHRHVQGPERVRARSWCCPACSSSSACSPAAAREFIGGGIAAADRHGRPVPVVLARRLGPVRVLRDPADGAHLRDQPLGERALAHRRGRDRRRRGRAPRSSRCCCRSSRSRRCSRSARRCRRATTPAIPAASAATSWRSRWRSTIRSAWGRCNSNFPEAPHNIYLNSFITGGWISGAAYLTLTLVTLVAGLRFVFVAHALAADLPCRLRGLRRRRRRERHHRQRPLAPLFPDRRRAVGPDGGVAGLSASAGRPGGRRSAAAAGLNTAPLRNQAGQRIRSRAGIGGA